MLADKQMKCHYVNLCQLSLKKVASRKTVNAITELKNNLIRARKMKLTSSLR